MLVRSLGGEDPLEKGMGSHSSILAWRNPWTEEPGGLQSIVSQRVGHDWSDLACNLQFQGRFIPISSRPFLRPVVAYVMNPWRRVWQTTPVATLQYSCLENPMDRGAWRATVHSVTKSWTRLKLLSTQSSVPGLICSHFLEAISQTCGSLLWTHGGGCGKPLQYSCLENPMDRGAWRATVHSVTKSRTWLKGLCTHMLWL